MKALKPTAKGRSQKAQRAPDAQELAPHSSLRPLLPPKPAGPGVQRARVTLIPHRPSSRQVLHLNFHGQFQWALSHPLLSAPGACTSLSPCSVAVSLHNECISAPRALRRLLGCPDLCTRAPPRGCVCSAPRNVWCSRLLPASGTFPVIAEVC